MLWAIVSKIQLHLLEREKHTALNMSGSHTDAERSEIFPNTLPHGWIVIPHPVNPQPQPTALETVPEGKC